LWGCPNAGLLSLSGIVKNDFDEITIIDEDHDPIPFDKEFDMVALGFITQQAYPAYEMLKNLRRKDIYFRRRSFMSVVFRMKQYTLRYYFRGEAELTWREFINDYKNNRPKKIYEIKQI